MASPPEAPSRPVGASPWPAARSAAWAAAVTVYLAVGALATPLIRLDESVRAWRWTPLGLLLLTDPAVHVHSALPLPLLAAIDVAGAGALAALVLGTVEASLTWRLACLLAWFAAWPTLPALLDVGPAGQFAPWVAFAALEAGGRLLPAWKVRFRLLALEGGLCVWTLVLAVIATAVALLDGGAALVLLGLTGMAAGLALAWPCPAWMGPAHRSLGALAIAVGLGWMGVAVAVVGPWHEGPLAEADCGLPGGAWSPVRLVADRDRLYWGVAAAPDALWLAGDGWATRWRSGRPPESVPIPACTHPEQVLPTPAGAALACSNREVVEVGGDPLAVLRRSAVAPLTLETRGPFPGPGDRRLLTTIGAPLLVDGGQIHAWPGRLGLQNRVLDTGKGWVAHSNRQWVALRDDLSPGPLLARDPGMVMHAALDDGRSVVWAADSLRGGLARRRATDLEPLGFVPLGFGPRHLALSPGGTALAVDYFTGRAAAVAPDGRILANTRVGPRARSVVWDEAGSQFVGVSGCGVYGLTDPLAAPATPLDRGGAP